jgi:uncharacterized membrane protein YeaQ/YmgE (transglycosylase-associated protein family)
MVLVMIFAWLLFGFIVGAIARAIMPGPQPMSLFGTAALGIVGSFVGGLIGNVLFGVPVFAFHAAGLLGSVVGALVVMGLAAFSSRAAHA